jgi:predicted Zn-dependent peptidase
LIDDYDLLRATAFEGHSLGFPVTGTVETVEGFDLARVRRHHVERYVGGATVVAVAGPIDVDRAARALERHFGDLPGGELPRVEAPAPQDAMRVKFVNGSSSQTALRIGFRGEGVHAAEEPATETLLRILDDGNSTRLYRRLCDERGLAYDVAAGYEALEDAGLLDVGSDTAHPQAATVLSEILDVIRDVRDAGPTDAELAKAKARHRWGLEEMLDDPGAAADFLADGALRSYAETFAERAERLDAVTADQVRRAAERVFRPASLSAVIVGSQPKRARARLTEILHAFR